MSYHHPHNYRSSLHHMLGGQVSTAHFDHIRSSLIVSPSSSNQLPGWAWYLNHSLARLASRIFTNVVQVLLIIISFNKQSYQFSFDILPALKNRQEAKGALQPPCQPPAVPLPLTRGLVQWSINERVHTFHGPSNRIEDHGNCLPSELLQLRFSVSFASASASTSLHFNLQLQRHFNLQLQLIFSYN